MNDSSNPLHVNPSVERYICPEGIIVDYGNYTWTNDSYNECKIVQMLWLTKMLYFSSFQGIIVIH